MSPAGTSALSKDSGHNQEKPVCSQGPVEALAPTPVLSWHPGKRVRRLSATVMKRMLLPPRKPSASAGCSALLSLHALLSPPPLFPAPSFLQFLSVIAVGTGATLPQATLM